MKILDLPLKKEWYDMIESGVKPEEYREIKPYWCERLLGMKIASFSCRYGYQSCNPKGFTHIRFRYGYTKRTMLFELKGITIGKGKTEWGAPNDRGVFILKLGNKIKEE